MNMLKKVSTELDFRARELDVMELWREKEIFQMTKFWIFENTGADK